MQKILFWALVGAVAGATFGWTAGIEGRILVFLIALGAGLAAVPRIEWWVRRTSPRPTLSSLEDREKSPAIISSPLQGEGKGEVLSPGEARQWLDDFLTKQQEVE